jgi:hypothetical protein
MAPFCSPALLTFARYIVVLRRTNVGSADHRASLSNTFPSANPIPCLDRNLPCCSRYRHCNGHLLSVIPLDLMLPNLSYCSPAGSHKLCETKSSPLYADSEGRRAEPCTPFIPTTCQICSIRISLTDSTDAESTSTPAIKVPWVGQTATIKTHQG